MSGLLLFVELRLRLLLLMVLGMNTLVLFEILWSLERLPTSRTRMRLQWRVYPDVRSDVISLCTCDVTAFPPTGQAEIVGGLSSDVVVAQVLIQGFRVVVKTPTVAPLADCGCVVGGAVVTTAGEVVACQVERSR